MKQKKPDSRFKEFDVNWSMSPAIEIFSVETDKGYPDLPVLSASQELGMVKRDNIGINMQYSKQNVASYKRVLPGRFVIHLRSFQGGFAHSAIEGITSPAYTVLSLREPQKHDDYFWKYLFTSPEFIKRLELVTYGIRDGRSISVEDFFELPFCYPSTPEEQHEIAQFFSRLDTLIAAEDKKLARLKNMKAASLEKMFPKQGETIPQVRFKGFTGEWEERELGDISNKVLEKNTKNTIREVFTNSAEYGIVSQRDFFNHDIANSKSIFGYYVVEPNDFVYNPRMSVTAPVGPINRNKLSRSGVMSPLYYIFRTHDIHEGYLEYYFKTTHWYKFMYNNGDNGARGDRFSIKDDTLIRMPIPIPKDEKEQIHIADFFSRLDTLISAQEQKLDKLRSLKKSFLEKMFVNVQN